MINIQLITNNREDNLFKYFLPSLQHLISLKDEVLISINFNNEAIKKHQQALKILDEYGFKYKYILKTYVFPIGKHTLIPIREDCFQIDKTSDYILFLDDDFEFLKGYDLVLKDAIYKMKNNKYVGIIQFYDTPLYLRKTNGNFILKTKKDLMALCGGLLAKRIPNQNFLYSNSCQKLYGGGEERLIALEYQNIGYEAYSYHTSCYKHEQHWREGLLSGQAIYSWEWQTTQEGTIMYYINKILEREK